MSIQAKDIMNTDVVCAREDMGVGQLVQLLQENKISGAPVIDSADALVGVVSTSDVMFASQAFGGDPVVYSDFHTHYEIEQDASWDTLAAEELNDVAIRDIMATGVITARSDTPIAELAGIMHSHRIHRVIIVEEEKLAGIVTTMDILKAVMEKKVS